MGGKGRKRREKNYRAAHGGHSRLPPPPVPSSVDAMPSKLRKLMALTNSSHSGSARLSVDTERKNRGGGGGGSDEKKRGSDDAVGSKTREIKEEENDEHLAPQHKDHGDETFENSTFKKKEKKRKRKRVEDHRFETAEELGVGLKRRERKKKRLEAMKKKHKKVKAEENLDFPGHEEVKFGDIVEAPPKLNAIPKAFKAAQDASQERLRLQAVEAYRNRRGWASRPGIYLPQTAATLPSL